MENRGGRLSLDQVYEKLKEEKYLKSIYVLAKPKAHYRVA